ncbi:hypothetical protein [Neisseria sp. Ec49-e6-T10]|uniref:hypothetical protein n=1 Tax=Neisseria sp. Ec49-e6-T10 TaxID=3140744 RepID=UPI003EBEFE1D
MMITLLCLSVYIIFAGYLCFKNNQFSWLWTTIFLWLVATIALSKLLPGIYTLFSTISLYPAPLYFLLGSIIYFIKNTQYKKETKQWYFTGQSTLSSFALSNLFIHLGFGFLLLAIYLFYPYYLQSLFVLNTLNQYFLQPIWIIGLQITLMCLIMLYVKFNQLKIIKMSFSQAILFISLTALFSVILTIIDVVERYAQF